MAAAGFAPPVVAGTRFALDPGPSNVPTRSTLVGAVTARVLERIRSGPRQDERIARLSRQERLVLELLAEGLTNRQIAERLYLAEKTIKNYVTSVLSKLGMARRTEAAVYAARHLRSDPAD